MADDGWRPGSPGFVMPGVEDKSVRNETLAAMPDSPVMDDVMVGDPVVEKCRMIDRQ